MTESQRKIIGFIVAAGFCSVLQVAALSATLTDGVEGNCPPGTMCVRPTRTLHVLLGDYDGRVISHEQFAQYRVGAIILTSLAELACVFVVIKTLRDQEAARKTPMTGRV